MLAIPSVAFAGGPKSTFPYPRGLDAEFIQVYHDIANPVINVGSASTMTITSLVGVTDGSNACSGCYGEYVSSTTAANATPPPDSTFGDALSLNLTSGDWDVTGMIYFSRNGSTWSGTVNGISSTAGNSNAGLTLGLNRNNESWASSSSTPIESMSIVPAYRVSISAATTYYLKVLISYSAGSPIYQASIHARRVR